MDPNLWQKLDDALEAFAVPSPAHARTALVDELLLRARAVLEAHDEDELAVSHDARTPHDTTPPVSPVPPGLPSERDIIVAWLRSGQGAAVADAIDRGDHLEWAKASL